MEMRRPGMYQEFEIGEYERKDLSAVVASGEPKTPFLPLKQKNKATSKPLRKLRIGNLAVAAPRGITVKAGNHFVYGTLLACWLRLKARNSFKQPWNVQNKRKKREEHPSELY